MGPIWSHLFFFVCKAKNIKNVKNGTSRKALWPNHMITFVLDVYKIRLQSSCVCYHVLSLLLQGFVGRSTILAFFGPNMNTEMGVGIYTIFWLFLITMVTIFQIFMPYFKLGRNLSSCQVSEKFTHRFGQNDCTNIQTDRQTDRQTYRHLLLSESMVVLSK